MPREEILETFSQRFHQEDRNRGAIRTDVDLRTPMEDLPTRTDLAGIPVRMLDPDGEPILVVTGVASRRTGGSSVEEALWLGEEARESPEIHHTLIVRDETLQEMGRLSAPAPPLSGGISTFVLRHPRTPLHFTLLADLPEEDQASVPEADHFEAPPRLSADSSSLEVSDVVVGIPLPEELDPESLAFPVLPTNRVWPSDPVRVYLEAYHLRMEGRETAGVARYAVDITLERVDRPTQAPPVTLSMTLESSEPTARRTFDLNLRDVSPGRYLLEVRLRDLASGEVRTRSRPLEIID